MRLHIKKSHLEEIIEHARKEFPNEACGILAGKEGKVSEVFRMANTERGAMRYAMALKEQFDIARVMRAKGTEMIGIYHSHPNLRAAPSFRDIQMALHPECSYVIVSLINNMPDVRSFRIIRGVVEEEHLDVS